MTKVERIQELIDDGEHQGRLCTDNGSRSYAIVIDDLVRQLRDLLAGETATPTAGAVAILLDDDRPATGSAIYLRLFGAVRRALYDASDHPLATMWLKGGPALSDVDLVAAFTEFVGTHDAEIRAGIAADVQTNEIGRAAVLSAGLQEVALRMLPRLSLREVGASAGLNLWPDRVRVEAGTTASGLTCWGPTDAPITLTGAFRSGTPRTTASGNLDVVDRRGCDITPLDPDTPADRRLLESFVWPENVERATRLGAALDGFDRAVVDKADACDWVEQQLARRTPDATTVIYHSVVLVYLDDADKDRFAKIIRTAGQQAPDDQPIAWLSYEIPPGDTLAHLVLETWPGGERTRLATGRPHGIEVDWQPTPLPNAASADRPR